MSADPNCIFCKIAQGQIPARKVYEDDLILAFHDIQPVTPVHVLVIPKPHLATLSEATPEYEAALGRMLGKAGEIARLAGATDGFRSIINTGRVGGQEVYHVHMHILGGPEPLGGMVKRQRAE